MKKYISIILVLIIVAGLTACGKDNATETTTDTRTHRHLRQQ